MSEKSTIIGGLLLPAGQAIVSGILFAALAVSCWKVSQGVTAWRLFGAALAVGCFIAWLSALRKINAWGDADHGIVPLEPETVYPVDTVQLNIVWADGGAGEFTRLGVDLERFAKWCAGISQGRPLGENHWTGANGLFSKGEYHVMRDELEVRGLIRMRGRHSTGGYELTSKGRAVVCELARQYGRGMLHPLPANWLRVPEEVDA